MWNTGPDNPADAADGVCAQRPVLCAETIETKKKFGCSKMFSLIPCVGNTGPDNPADAADGVCAQRPVLRAETIETKKKIWGI